MAGDTPVSRYAVIANTPWEAAAVGTKKEVQARRDERLWVRVTEESSRVVYKLRVQVALAGGRNASPWTTLAPTGGSQS